MRDSKPENTMALLKSCLSDDFQQQLEVYSRTKKAVFEALPKHLATSCRVNKYQNSVLILECANSSWATKLKFERLNLLNLLRKQGLPSLMTIEIRINPDIFKTQQQTNQQENTISNNNTLSEPVISAKAAHILRTTTVNSDKLKARLDSIAALSAKDLISENPNLDKLVPFKAKK